jgi:hypothetical protein
MLCQALAGRPDQADWSALSPGEWEKLVVSAKQHGVAPLLYHALHATDVPIPIPSPLWQTLQQEYYLTTAYNTLLYGELNRILTALQQEHIPIVVLKGAALANTLYPEIGLRPMADIDLLVPGEHLERAVQVVCSLGYDSSEKRAGFGRAHMHHISLHNRLAHHSILEIHHDLIIWESDCRPPSLDWFWSQSRVWPPAHKSYASEEGVPPGHTGSLATITQFSPAANLLYLAAHITLQHGVAWSKLIWLYDIHLLLTHHADDIDYDDLLTQARSLRWSAALHMALEQTQRCFGSPLPHGLLAALKAQCDPQAVRLVQQKASPTSSRTRNMLRELVLMSWQERISFMSAIIFPDPRYMRYRYNPDPPWLLPLSYPYRWLDIGWDALRTLINVVWRL